MCLLMRYWVVAYMHGKDDVSDPERNERTGMNRESIEAFYKDIPSKDILGAVEVILVLYEAQKDPELIDIVKVMREMAVALS